MKISRKRSFIKILKDFLNIKKKNKILINLLNIQNQNIKNFSNIAVPAFDYISTCIMIFGQYEKMELDSIVSLCKKKLKNKTVLDVGAHIGNHSIFFSKYSKKIFSFEPNDFTYKFLKFNAEFHKNIYTFNFGASNKNCNLKMISAYNNLGMSRIGLKVNSKKQFFNNKKSSFKKFDNLKFLKRENIGLIKLDVENHEIESLKGMKQIIKKKKPIIIFECSYNNKDLEVFNLLKNFGYKNLYVLKKPKWSTSERLNPFLRNASKILESIFFKAPEYKYKLAKASSLDERAMPSHFALMTFSKI